MANTAAKTDETPAKPPAEAMAEAAALGSETSPKTAVNALAYFMGEEPAPGSTDTFELELDFGNYDEPKLARVKFRTLTADELNAADDNAIVKDSVGRDKGINSFIRSCWIMAAAQIEPPLGPVLNARNQAGGKFRDSAHLLSTIFERAPGVPMRVETIIRKRSRTDFDDAKAVREIEAGKP